MQHENEPKLCRFNQTNEVKSVNEYQNLTKRSSVQHFKRILNSDLKKAKKKREGRIVCHNKPLKEASSCSDSDYASQEGFYTHCFFFSFFFVFFFIGFKMNWCLGKIFFSCYVCSREPTILKDDGPKTPFLLFTFKENVTIATKLSFFLAIKFF